MGYPYFNPPNIQKINTIEQGNFFVPTEGVEPESVNDIPPARAKIMKIVKVCGIAVAVAVFVAIGVMIVIESLAGLPMSAGI